MIIVGFITFSRHISSDMIIVGLITFSVEFYKNLILELLTNTVFDATDYLSKFIAPSIYRNSYKIQLFRSDQILTLNFAYHVICSAPDYG